MDSNRNSNIRKVNTDRKFTNNDRAKHKEINDIIKQRSCTDCGQCNQFDGVCVYDDSILERGR